MIKKLPLSLHDKIHHIGWKSYCLIYLVSIVDFFLSSVSVLLFYQNLNALGRYLLVFAIYIMIIMSIFLLLLYFRLQHYHAQLKEINNENQKMLELEMQHYKEMQRKTMDLRSFRHDYNYHVTAMQGLVTKEDWSGLKKYVASLSETKEQLYYISTNHPVADAILNYFYENIPSNTVFQLDGKFPENVFFDDVDICIILSNLLKNATEAIAKLPLNTKKKLYISLYANEQYASILVENTSMPYQDDILEHLSTSKSDTLNHGLGLKNVRKVVQRYHGKLDIHYHNETFTAAIFLHHAN
ncbi:MAG: GHKL domain-containing protein [Eubacterium sp.]|nr:GHKL domain-containing protein [Eubacterium sp.]